MPYRKRETSAKERICEALIRLVAKDQKPYDEITIQEIVEEAGVCRNSFYRNYQSKNDIFTEKFLEISIQSGKLLETLEGDFVQNIFYSFFETSRRNRDFLLSFYKASPRIYFETFTGTILQSNTSRRPEDLPPEKYYRYASRAWITVGILTEWISRDCDTPIEDIISWFREWCTGLID